MAEPFDVIELHELVTPDADAAVRFYEGLFGWSAEEIPDAGGYGDPQGAVFAAWTGRYED